MGGRQAHAWGQQQEIEENYKTALGPLGTISGQPKLIAKSVQALKMDPATSYILEYTPC